MTTPIISAPDSVISLRVFGSYYRGDNDPSSDIDVLAVHRSRPPERARQHLKSNLSLAFGRNVDLAEYSENRLREMFSAGHLFAWHLQSESSNLMEGPDQFFDSLGSPAPYLRAKQDALHFLQLLQTTAVELDISGTSTIYEAGLLYLASRNIGICASSQLCHTPDFSRYAIKNVCERLNIAFELLERDYGILIACRSSTIRGLDVLAPTVKWVRERAEMLTERCTEVCRAAFGDCSDE